MFTSLLLTLGGIVSIFFAGWIVGLACSALGLFVVGPMARKTAASAVIETALKDSVFYYEMLTRGVIHVFRN